MWVRTSRSVFNPAVLGRRDLDDLWVLCQNLGLRAVDEVWRICDSLWVERMTCDDPIELLTADLDVLTDDLFRAFA